MFISRIFKNLSKSRKQSNLKKWAKDVNRNFTKEGKRQLSI